MIFSAFSFNVDDDREITTDVSNAEEQKWGVAILLWALWLSLRYIHGTAGSAS